MVEAVETGKTMAVVQPLWRQALAALNVVHGTDISTLATLYAAVFDDMKRFVCDEAANKERAYKPTVYSWPAPSVGLRPERSAMHDVIDHAVKPYLRCLNFLCLTFRRVHIHEGQTHIRFGHEQRRARIKVYASGLEVRSKDVERLTDGVARCAESINEMSMKIVNLQSADKLSNDKRRAPSMHRKTKAQPLTFFERDLYVGVGCGHELHAVARGGHNLFSSPFCVACCGKIKYHAAKLIIFFLTSTMKEPQSEQKID